jgi:predicted nuclease of predicted toxin-antitoxin system
MTSLLLDHNLSPKLIQRVLDLYPGSSHVHLHGLDTADDLAVWTYARQHEYIIVTKDADFSELQLLHGFPPKIIWIRRGNCSTQAIEALLRDNFEVIKLMSDDPETGVIALF